ncbi:MAG: ADP-glyceromanno-heptose 6-epimerase [bacterium]|nr:ADP-glyceromanno-heptose 6-epimerase [bacterium]
MIVVTGGAGFIGSRIINGLNQRGITDILVVDHMGTQDKYKNLIGLRYADYLEKDRFLDLIEYEEFHAPVSAIIHMGACSATTELDGSFLMENNLRYSQVLARFCREQGARFIYASSAATYGDGDQGYSDQSDLLGFKPLNPYGFSKYAFDLWAEREGLLDQIVGLKFFNVYGPNERHKGDMRSVVSKAFDQIQETGLVKLFKSHRPDFEDGQQLRDFVYVEDAVKMVLFFLEHPAVGGVFNVGTGEARSFKDLVSATFRALGKEPNIEFIPMPEHLRERYQYYTQAAMDKARAAGYQEPMTSLEVGVSDYVQNYLLKGN